MQLKYISKYEYIFTLTNQMTLTMSRAQASHDEPENKGDTQFWLQGCIPIANVEVLLL